MALNTKGSARSRVKFAIDSASKLTLNADIGESIAVGNRPGDDEDMLVWSVGVNAIAIPVYAVGSAVAAGKVFSPDDVVSAFVETGKFAALKRAVEAQVKRDEKAAPAKTPTA